MNNRSQAITILILILLAGCTQIDTQESTIGSEPIPREEPIAPEPVVEDLNDSQVPKELQNSSGLQDAIANDTGHDEWEKWYGVSAATLLVTDGRKAARLYLPQGKRLQLPLDPPIELIIPAIGTDGRVLIDVNGETKIMGEREDEPFLNGSIRVFVREVIVVE